MDRRRDRLPGPGGAGDQPPSSVRDAEGTSRWVKKPDSEQIFSISSWAGDWTTAELSKFQKKDTDKDKKAKGDDAGADDSADMAHDLE